MPTGLDPDLNEAMRKCVRAALNLIEARWGVQEHLAYAYLSAATDFDISQVVDIVCGVHARIRESDFAGVDRARRGAHRKQEIRPSAGDSGADPPASGRTPVLDSASPRRRRRMPETAIPGAETIPADLLEAFTAYERAIMANDLDVLDASFAPGERHDAGGCRRPARRP